MTPSSSAAYVVGLNPSEACGCAAINCALRAPSFISPEIARYAAPHCSLNSSLQSSAATSAKVARSDAPTQS